MCVEKVSDCFWRELGEIIPPVVHGSRSAVSGWYLLPRKEATEEEEL